MKKSIIIITVILTARFMAGGQTSSVTENTYQSYNGDGFITQQSSPQSNGDVLVTNNQYADDLSASMSCGGGYTTEALGIRNLVNINRINKPIESYTQINHSSTSYVVGADLYLFYPTQPYAHYWYKLETQVPYTLFHPYHAAGCGFVRDANYVLQESYNIYDSYGNVLEKTIKGGKNVAFIYDYKGAYKTAIAENAKNSQIAYTSFETGPNTGNWHFPSLGIETVPGGTTPIAGSNCYNVNTSSGATITSSTLPVGNYIVSFWLNGPTPIVTAISGGSTVFAPSATGAVVSGWTYYEYSFSNVTSVTIKGTGSLIDELRLYPKNAEMETVEYNPLVGMSYTCDVAGHFAYYTYDDLNRLLYIKDQNGNIIKQMEYGIQKPE